MSRLLINFAAFQAGWFACVLGAAHGLPLLGPLVVLAVVALHLVLSRRPATELRLILSAMVAGVVADSLLVFSGWVSYPTGTLVPGMAPYWIIAMWALFATTLNVSMKWLRDRPVVTVMMGAIGGPMSYLAGQKLGAITFLQPLPALAALTLIWALAMPLLMLAATRLDGVSQRAKPDFVQDDWRLSNHA